jgi:hypothetical protein
MVPQGGGRLLGWDAMYTEFRGTYCRLLQGGVGQASTQQEAGGRRLVSLFDPKDGGRTFLRNVGKRLPGLHGVTSQNIVLFI